MNSRKHVWSCAALRTFVMMTVSVSLCVGQQISIPRVEVMPNTPAPYEMRNWKHVASAYDSLVFNPAAVGTFLPLVSVDQNFSLSSYVGQSPAQTKEAINCLPALVSAALVGTDKTNQFGVDWVAKSQYWFNTNPLESVYLNSPGGSSGNDWWYDVMPNVFFFQLYSFYPITAGFQQQLRMVADRWLAALNAMGAGTTPWSIANVDHRGWFLATMTPNNSGVREPESAGSIAWLLYNAYVQTGYPKYRIGAELAMESLLVFPPNANPSYELQLPYGTCIAARMNAELGTTFDIEKLMTWCFSDGRDNSRLWGVTTGRWGGYDCFGLIGETSEATGNGYAFAMNTFEQIGALVPLVRYDARYARIVGKWVLNAVNASRLFYTNYLPDQNQDGVSWSRQFDPSSVIAHESIHQFDPAHASVSPFATGDAIRNGNPTNFALYGSSHAGILGGIIDTTDVPMILKLDVVKTDYFHAAAYPTSLFFNPDSIRHSVKFDAGMGLHDLYDAASHSFIARDVTGITAIPIDANSAVLAVNAPANGTVNIDIEKLLINGIVVDYHSGRTVLNYPPRIRSLASDTNSVIRKRQITVYCSAIDRDNDTLKYSWNASGGTITGNASVVSWTAPDSAGIYIIRCNVDDGHGGAASSADTITVVESINHTPVILRMNVSPRKLGLGASCMVTCSASDPDGNALSFHWSARSGVLGGSGSAVSWRAPMSRGDYVLACTVEDGLGGIAKDSVAVEVRDLSAYVKGNLLASYPFSNGAVDVSGNSRNGTVNNAIPTKDRHGIANTAYLFDGSTSSIRIPNDNGLNTQKSFALNCWMKIGAFYTREQYPLSHGNYQNRWKVSISNKHLRWTVNTSAGIKDLDSETELTLDSLYNLSVQYDGSDMEIYLNGALDAFIPWSGALKQTSIDITIGQDLPGDNNYNFNGVLDDLRLFDYGLSTDEISAFAADATPVLQHAFSVIPSTMELHAYPNPFNPGTTIRISLPTGDHVTVSIFDILGREVAQLTDKSLPAGIIELKWNAARYPSGIYYCVMKSSRQTLVNKLLLMK